MDDQYKISSDSKSDIVTFQDILGEQYLAKYEEKIKLKWQISSDTQDFNGIKCQKATTEYGGRKWITWFASEYNFHFGPYKFQGLPGLIIKIWDTENNFMWDFVGLKKQNSDNFYENTYLELQGWQIANLDKKNFLKVEHQYFNHPLGNISEIFPDASGDKIQKILEIEREKIKRNQYMNNKIEITQK